MILRFAERHEFRWLTLSAWVLTGGAVCSVVMTMITLHPFQYIYFNPSSGGLPAAYNRDETDYWGISHKEAATWLNQWVEALGEDSKPIYRVHLGYTTWMLDAF